MNPPTPEQQAALNAMLASMGLPPMPAATPVGHSGEVKADPNVSGFTPANQEPQKSVPDSFIMSPMEEDLSLVLRRCILEEDMILETPETVFAQQILRRVERMEDSLNELVSLLVPSPFESAPTTAQDTLPKSVEQKLIFSEPKVSDGKKEKDSTVTRLRKRNKKSKTKRGNAQKRRRDKGDD